jgi:hypothetical protein
MKWLRIGPEIGTSSIDWAQLSRFCLKTETESSFRNAVFWNINRMVFLNRDKTMDNVQKHNICRKNCCCISFLSGVQRKYSCYAVVTFAQTFRTTICGILGSHVLSSQTLNLINNFSVSPVSPIKFYICIFHIYHLLHLHKNPVIRTDLSYMCHEEDNHSPLP